MSHATILIFYPILSIYSPSSDFSRLSLEISVFSRKKQKKKAGTLEQNPFFSSPSPKMKKKRKEREGARAGLRPDQHREAKTKGKKKTEEEMAGQTSLTSFFAFAGAANAANAASRKKEKPLVQAVEGKGIEKPEPPKKKKKKEKESEIERQRASSLSKKKKVEVIDVEEVDADDVMESAGEVVVATETKETKDTTQVVSTSVGRKRRRRNTQVLVEDEDSDEQGDENSESDYTEESESESEFLPGEAEEEIEEEEEDISVSPAASMKKGKKEKSKKKETTTKRISKRGSVALKEEDEESRSPRKRGSAAGAPARSKAKVNLRPSQSPGELKEKLEGCPLSQGSTQDTFTKREQDPKFSFLYPPKLKDAKGRKTGDEKYDPSTLYIPQTWFKEYKISPGQQQWWTFKSQHFDSVLLFKMGKFYEMYEMDAHIGVEHLGLMYMKGEQPHCGFPERSYSHHAEKLARKGFKVVVIEQTETPEQLSQRNIERRKAGKKSDTVVRREKVAVLSPGTLFDYDMVKKSPQSSYIVSVAEGTPAGGTEKSLQVEIGVSAVDVTTGKMLLGQLCDNASRSKLCTFLTAIRPLEVIIPKVECSASGPGQQEVMIRKETKSIMEKLLNGAKVTQLIPEEQFWTGERGLEAIATYFEDGLVPKILRDLRDQEQPDQSQIALHALGGMVSFLQRSMLDQAVIPVCQFEMLPKDGIPCLADDEVGARLDASALANLEIVENSEGGLKGTLLSQLDHCSSGPGKRLLRQWLLHPLKNISSIRSRQQAVKELKNSRVAEDFHCGLRRIPDLERCLTRMAASAKGTGRDGHNVVLYEDNARKTLKAFLSTLNGFKTLCSLLKQLSKDIPSPKSPLLKALLSLEASLPEMGKLLSSFEDAFDWVKAEKEGRVVPNKGVDADYDSAIESVSTAESELDDYLQEQRDLFGSRKIDYVSIMGTKYQIEVPEGLRSKIPAYYELTSRRKGNGKQVAVTRYHTTELREMIGKLTLAEENLEKTLSQILKNLIAEFCSHASTWQTALDASAKLDCLFAFSIHAENGHEMCEPSFQESDKPRFFAEALSHPAGGFVEESTFVTNDINLGGESPPFVLLTGPNMGGKSTLMRQVCLATILAQVGAHVPAKSLSLTPVDAVFVRMGARDSILTGQSTFHVELSETSTILDLATPKSLVALDEFGRGTATSDGIALAAAVMQHLMNKVGCLTLFATHYHAIALENEGNKAAMTCHMACQVNGEDPSAEQRSSKDDIPDVTFLYKLRHGICPNSYGVSVAKLAGIPAKVLDRAVQIQMND